MVAGMKGEAGRKTSKKQEKTRITKRIERVPESGVYRRR